MRIRAGISEFVLAVALAHVLTFAASTSASQGSPNVVSIPDEPQCRTCEIRAARIRSWEMPDDSADGFPIGIRSDNLGRFWVLRRGDVPAVFDSSGRFLRAIGRHGRGPGEYMFPTEVLAVPPDTVVVLDGDLRRATVLDRTFQVARTVALPMHVRGPVVLSWPGRVLGSGSVSARGAAAKPLHELSFASGNRAVVTRSFGAAAVDSRRGGMVTTSHSLTAPGNGAFWAGWMFGYQLTRFAVDGRALRLIGREPDWFREPSQGGLGTPSTPPPSLLVGLEEDRQGRLWTFLRVPSKSWKAAWPTLPPGTREVSSRSIAVEKLYDTLIEVIDPRAGRVIARRRLDGYFVGALPGLRGAMYEVSEDGEGRISILTFALIGP